MLKLTETTKKISR